MNLDNSSTSNNLSLCQVTSKYFSGKPGMDESLSDFQEKKKNCAGPKNCVKPSGSISKSKKNLKRIKGQKDIRTVLKSKKNELVTYNNDFDKICKQSGIDIDSEQLQLAIALSKSLQHSEIQTESNTSQSSLNSQERVGRIRTTLLEYGFKVPEIKITNKSKRQKHKKNYKLLLTTEAERQQIITDKYSQVLFQNYHSLGLNNKDLITAEVHLYHIATDITYESLNSNDRFYVKDLLFDTSINTVGCLLKDWSKIPGRPASPVCEKTNVKFSETELSQKELDTVLSGTVKSCQDIIQTKHIVLQQENMSICIDKDSNIKVEMDTNPIEIVDLDENEKGNSDTLTESSIRRCKDRYIESKINTDTVEIIDLEESIIDNPSIVVNKPVDVNIKECNSLQIGDRVSQQQLSLPLQPRSCSPDIFDDDVSSLMDNSKGNANSMSEEVFLKTVVIQSSDVMDLTECVNINSQRIISADTCEETVTQLSQENITKRRSNDFMEITSCVASVSQSLVLNVEENLDLEMNYENKMKDVENVDLTQSSNSNDSLPFVLISGKNCTLDDDTILLNEDAYDGINPKSNCSTQNFKENSDISTELVLPKNTIQDKTDNLVADRIDTENESTSSKASTHKDLCDIKILQDNFKSRTTYFLEEHSNKASKEDAHEDIVCLDDSGDKSANDENYDNKEDNIDLTQTSGSDVATCNVENTNSPHETNSLGKNGDVSIDYDEIYDNLVENCNLISKQSSLSNKSLSNDTTHNNTDGNGNHFKTSNSGTNSSQNSDVFEISDKELDYSLHRSKHENKIGHFDIGGLSVMNDLSKARSSKSSCNSEENRNNESVDESFLPMVDLKNCNSSKVVSPVKLNHNDIETPFKTFVSKKNIPVETPQNEYVIKTNDVTPMTDYASLTTPERNKELDKYGLKPLKRKRAIQLLTHIYNQTHPIVESCSTEEQSPSKKLKRDLQSNQGTSPNKQYMSSKKKFEWKTNTNAACSQLPVDLDRNRDQMDKENNMYEVTKETPDIRDIECSDQDWVFQKKEKAKVSSCRVPMHIAFHNYVSARRGLRDAILRYEPVDIDVIHKGLVADGHRYDPKDLLKFMDKKCITVKTADNNSRNKKHY